MLNLRTGVFLALLLLASVSFAGISVTDFSVSKASYQPGDIGIATITIANSADTPTVSGLAMTINNPPELSVSGASSLADIASGSSMVVSIPFTIKSDAKSGIYLLNVNFVGYEKKPGMDLQTSVTNTVAIPIEIVKAPIISLAVDKPLIGGVETILFSITNNGGTAKNLRFTMSGPVGLYGTDEVYIGDLVGQVNESVALDARNAPDGPIDVPVLLMYDDGIGMPHTDNGTLHLTVRNEKLDLKFMQLSDVITGKESNLTLQVRNDGATPLTDVRLSFQNSTSVRLKDQSEMKFGDIAPGASATSSVVVVADLPPGVDQVDATADWIEKDIQHTEAQKIPITITSDADVGVFLEAKPSPLIAGGEHTISVLVSNLGSYPIDNVAVVFSSPSLDLLDISSQQYIGNLNNDDFSTVQFKVRAKQVPEGQYPVQVNITYRDQSGEWKTKIVNTDVSIYAAPSTGFDPIILLPLLVVAAGIVWWVFLRKKKPKTTE